ncbi:MAG: Eco57I restriction-modification methylase domain-containing protein [Candidatus Hodarchaeales archaeon]
MQQLYQRLKEFYEILLQEGQSLNWTPSETYDIALQSLIKVISLFYFKPWIEISNGSSLQTEKMNGCRNFFYQVFLPSDKAHINIDPIYQLINLTPKERKIIQTIPSNVWDNFITLMTEYHITLTEEFIENSETNRKLTPEFLSTLTEMVLNDYEKDFKVTPKVTKRKKKGAYYSPWSIIRKLTDRTLIDEKTSINKTVFDPSCGTGSFLLYAAERKYFLNTKYAEVTSTTSIEIIRNNIYGVDKSNPSILVTKLRLALWIMSKSPLIKNKINSESLRNIKEGNSLFGLANEEYQPTIDLINIIPKIKEEFNFDLTSFDNDTYNLQMWNELLSHIKLNYLPDQSDANSEHQYHKVIQLFNPILDNVYNQKLKSIVDKKNKSKSLIPEDGHNIRYFHWGLHFPEILLEGGFDVCLGNPPYGRSILTIAEKNLLKVSYKSCQGKNPKKVSLNAASAFLERSLTLLKDNGRLAFILPYSLLRVEEFEDIRKNMLEEFTINEIHDESSAFHDVTLEMCSMIISKYKIPKYKIRIFPRENYKALKEVDKNIFQTHGRYMIYSDELWEEVVKQGSLGVIMADYGIDHRIVKKDLLRTFSPSDGYTIPFLHSGKSVTTYALQPKFFHWAKANQKSSRFNKYVKESKLICTAIGNEFHVTYKPPGFVPGTNVSIMEITEPNFDLLPIMLILNSSLINYILKRYILNYSHLTVYLHKYYTKLIPIKYPSLFISEWTILASYISLLKQLVVLDNKRSYNIEISLLERIADYLVIQLYFPKFFRNLDLVLGESLSKFLVSIPFKTCFQVLLGPNTTNNRIPTSHQLAIFNSEKIVLNTIENLKEDSIISTLEKCKATILKHPIIPPDIL